MGDLPPLPPIKPSDPEDVSWALSTAQTSLSRGDPHEALKWLRRAAEAASEAEQDDRALELAKSVADLAAHVSASRPPPAPPQSSRPAPTPPVSSRPAAPAPAPSRPAAPRPPSAAPARPLHALTGARAPQAPASVRPPAAPKPKEPEKKRGRKSIPDGERTDVMRASPVHEPKPKEAKRRRDDLARPSNMDELEAMPTQTMEGDQLPSFDEVGNTRVGANALQSAIAAERGSLPIVAAARVHLVRDANGEVRVSIAAVEGSIPVLVVPLEPGTDLSKLFS